MNILDRTIQIRMSQVEVGATHEHVRTHIVGSRRRYRIGDGTPC